MILEDFYDIMVQTQVVWTSRIKNLNFLAIKKYLSALVVASERNQCKLIKVKEEVL